MCNFNGKSAFRCTQRAITQRRVITLGPIFIKMVFNRAQGLKEKKVKNFQREKLTTGRDITKNFEGGGADSAPALLGLKTIHVVVSIETF